MLKIINGRLYGETECGKKFYGEKCYGMKRIRKGHDSWKTKITDEVPVIDDGYGESRICDSIEEHDIHCPGLIVRIECGLGCPRQIGRDMCSPVEWEKVFVPSQFV